MIVYTDKDIAVCNKPFGVPSQQSNGDNMVARLKEALGGDIFPVHRLDTQTTGLIVYARNKKSAADLCRQVADKSLEKEYLCLCHGDIDERGRMVDFLYHDRLKNKSFTVKTNRKGAKEAVLEYERLCAKCAGMCELFLVRVKLFTGRTHQIRVQFSSRGYPLYGDGKYGASDNAKIHLHACALSFFHPVTKERLTFESKPDWAE